MGRKKIVKPQEVADSPKFSKTSKYIHLVFTLNNYVDNSLDKLKDWDQITYLIAGKEIAPNTGTPHLQGYFELKTNVLGSTIKNRLPSAHLEPRFGTAKQAADYCKKDGDIFIEQGKISQQGHRTDLDHVATLIMEGKPMKEIREENPTQYLRYAKNIKDMHSYYAKPRNTKPIVMVLYGSTGTGKTLMARKLMQDNAYYIWTPTKGHWFDGYDAHTHVIFDEYRGQLPIDSFLTLIDRNETTVQTKGSTQQFVATFIVITSPCHPILWNHNGGLNAQEDKYAQLNRRITHITNMDDSTQNPYLLSQEYKDMKETSHIKPSTNFADYGIVFP